MMPALEMHPGVKHYGGMLKWSEGKLVELSAEPRGMQEQALAARDEAVRWTIGLTVGGAVFLLGLEWSFGRFYSVVAALLG